MVRGAAPEGRRWQLAEGRDFLSRCSSENEDEIQRKLAYWIQGSRAKNEPIVNRVTHAFEIAGLALLVEIALLALGLTLS